MENYIIANYTDPGRVRTLNEDSMTTFDSPNGRVVVVCDGLGGQNAGEVASQLAVAVIQDILTDNTFNTPEEAIQSSVNAANQAILHRAAQDPQCSGMGSTCVMAIIKDGKVYYGSVGDSRIYYIAGNMIRQITKDQSYVQTLVDEGAITQEAAEHHQDKNQIMNALGIENMKPAVIGNLPITPEPGSCFVLCSDGLSGMISNNAILNTVMRRDLSLNERVRLLVNQANDAGGQDNITVQLIEFSANASSVYAAMPADRQQTGGEYMKQKRRSNSFAYVIIALFMMATVALGVYWYFFRNEAKPEPKVESTTKTRKKEQPVVRKKTTETKTVVVKETEPQPKPKAKQKRNPQNSIEKKIKKGIGNNTGNGNNDPENNHNSQGLLDEQIKKGNFKDEKDLP